MPGPGGGARGGGFGGGSRGGGFSGGGFGGGGFRGGPHYGFHRPFYGRRRGCLDSIIGLLLAPVIVLFVLFIIVGSSLTSIIKGGEVRYDEAAFQAYADKQYAAEFGTSSAYGDNLLIVFLTNKETDGYYAIAWVGDNIRSEINHMFGNDSTVFGLAVLSSINQTYYAYSLDSNLASVMDMMTNEVTSLGLESSFNTQNAHSSLTKSHVTNYTELSITESTVNRALEDFTKATDIPVVIVIDTMENVFGKSICASDIIVLVVFIGIAAVVIYYIVKTVKRRKDEKNNYNDSSYRGGYGGYDGYGRR